MIFDTENSLWKSNFSTLRWAGKARQSIRLWLILLDLMKNWVAEGVASDVNDFTQEDVHCSRDVD